MCLFADGNGTLVVVVADNLYDSDRMGLYRAGQPGVTPTPSSKVLSSTGPTSGGIPERVESIP